MTDAEQFLADLEAKARAIFSADQGECTLVEAQAILEDFSMAANPAAVLRLVGMVRELQAEVQRLEKEADWLATAAANGGWHGERISPEWMRAAARKACEEQK